MCGVDGCDWPGLEATAAECRDAAREHRESAHPELAEQDRKKHRAKEQARDRAERSAEKRRDMVAADADADQREDEPLPRTKRRYRFWNEESATEAFKAFEQRTGTPPGAADLATDPELPSFGTVKKLFGSLDAAVEKIWPQAVYPAAPNGNEHVEAPLPDLTAGELAGLREVENEVESELAEAVRERVRGRLMARVGAAGGDRGARRAVRADRPERGGQGARLEAAPRRGTAATRGRSVTPRQKRVLRALIQVTSDGWPASVREVARAAGMANAHSSVWEDLDDLKRIGLVAAHPRNSALGWMPTSAGRGMV